MIIDSGVNFFLRDADPGAFVAVGVHQHGREHKTEEVRRQPASLLHSVGHCECLGDSSVVRDSRYHTVVQLTHHLNESLQTVEFLHDLPQSFTIHRVEGFRQVHEGRVQVGPHLLALLLKLTGSEDHIRGPAMASKAASAFRQKALFQKIIQTVEEDASEDLPGDVQQGDATVIVADIAVPFSIVEMHDGCVFEISRTSPSRHIFWKSTVR
nr:unnamed protein product [Spirometra erinaceieuropaei]